MDIQSLLAEIANAFPAKPLPKMTLRQAVLADQSLARCITEVEWSAERRKDAHLTWLELSEEALLECSEGVAHLDEGAFAYYLGAFLGFAARHVETDAVGNVGRLFGTVLFSVTHRSHYNLSRLKALTDAQIDCVIHFLELVVERNELHATEASKSLQRYWKTSAARQRTVTDVP